MKQSTKQVSNEDVQRQGVRVANADIKAEGNKVAVLVAAAAFVTMQTLDTFGRGMKTRLIELDYSNPAVTVSQYKGALAYIIKHPAEDVSCYTLTELYDLGKSSGATSNSRKAGRKPISKQKKCNNAIAKLVKEYGTSTVRKALEQV